MLTPDEFKILAMNYEEQVRFYTREIRKKRDELRTLRELRKDWERKQRSLYNHELFEEYESKPIQATN